MLGKVLVSTTVIPSGEPTASVGSCLDIDVNTKIWADSASLTASVDSSILYRLTAKKVIAGRVIVSWRTPRMAFGLVAFCAFSHAAVLWGAVFRHFQNFARHREFVVVALVLFHGAVAFVDYIGCAAAEESVLVYRVGADFAVRWVED